MKKILLFLLINIISIGYAQTEQNGDYRSKGSGLWNESSTWQKRLNGLWDNSPDYPGQFVGSKTARVTVLACHTVTTTNPASAPQPNPQSDPAAYHIERLNIKGVLLIKNEFRLPSTIELWINGGSMVWDAKVGVYLKENAILLITGPKNGCSPVNPYILGLSDNNQCSANTALHIGDIKYTSCTGKGSSAAGDFPAVNAAGGSFAANPGATPLAICKNSRLAPKLSGNAVRYATGLGTISYRWHLISQPGTLLDSSKWPVLAQNVQLPILSNPGAPEGNYVFELEAYTSTFTNRKRISIAVNGSTEFDPITSSWSNDIPSLVNHRNAIIKGNYITATPDGSFDACSCLVTSNSSLTISPNTYVSLVNELNNNGTVVIESDANLIQINDAAVNTGNATVKRNSTMKRLDYTYWGTPVDKQQLKAFSPLTVASRFYSYNEKDDSFTTIPNIGGTAMIPGKGYVIRAPDNFPTVAQTFVGTYAATGSFTTKANNGVIPVSVTKLGAGKNLLGNPYPSNIDLVQLTSDNSTVLTGTYYFWTNNATWTSNTDGIGTIGNYKGNGYAAWNGSGGVQATNSAGASVGQIPTRYVKPGQGFLAEASQAGTVSFKNGIRTKEGGASPFFNRGTAEQNSVEAVSRFWLTLTTPVQTVSTVLVAYVQGATNAYDPGFDAVFPSEVSDRFFTLASDREVLIQGRQFPLTVTDVVSLGMSHYADGNYTIALAEREGIFANGQNVYLRDKATETVTNLSEGSYTYSAVHGISIDRFEITYRPENRMLRNDESSVQQNLIVYREGADFVIRSDQDRLKEIEVYDASGKLVMKKAGTSNLYRLNSQNFMNAIYVIRVTLENGKILTRKILK